MKYITKLFLVVCLIFCALFAHAQNPTSISIQGTLMDARGQAAKDGEYNVQFRLYDTPVGGTPNWFEDATVETSSGIYSHYLGSANPLTSDIFERTQYLGIQVGTIEIEPRTLITYAPYTFTCNYAEITQKVICSGAVGDIKYSMLNPGQFAQENGSCWVPLDGRNVNSSQWAQLTGQSTVPNISGMFIRSQEYTDGRDPGRTPTTAVATVQDQMFKTHTHTGTVGMSPSHSHTIPGGAQNADTRVPRYDATGVEINMSATFGTSTSQSGTHNHTLTISNNAGGDTRPKNLNLYAYIRVN